MMLFKIYNYAAKTSIQQVTVASFNKNLISLE